MLLEKADFLRLQYVSNLSSKAVKRECMSHHPMYLETPIDTFVLPLPHNNNNNTVFHHSLCAIPGRIGNIEFIGQFLLFSLG